MSENIKLEASIEINGALKKSISVVKEQDEEEGKSVYEVYGAFKGSSKIGDAMIGTAKGRWGKDVSVAISINKDGEVEDIVIVKSDERRGNITHKSFLSQFVGKTAGDGMVPQSDIMAVSGATVSSGTVCYIVKKLMMVYDKSK